MDQQRLDAKKMFKKLSFEKKVEHIWIYYKWRIIIPILVMLLVAYSVYDAMKKPKYDLEGSFYSAAYISDEKIAKMEDYLSQFVEDQNGDGKTNIKIHLVDVGMVDNEIEGTMIVSTKFSNEMAAGADSFMIVDNTFYETIMKEEFAQAIHPPQELTAVTEFQKALNFSEEFNVYWVTRAIYQNEKDDPEAIRLHDVAVRTEKKIFASEKSE